MKLLVYISKSKAMQIGLVIHCLLCFIPSLAGAQISYVNVEAEGFGAKKEDAIAGALLQAVSQVNGAEVAGQTLRSMKESSTESAGGNGYLLEESFLNEVSSRSKGIVKSWRVLRESQASGNNGLWFVSVTATIAKYEGSQQLKRLRMAVSDFRIEGSNKVVDGQLVATTFTKTLSDGLTQTRKFAMIDRSFLKEQDEELQRLSSGGYLTEELARIGGKAGTDYLIVGIVNKAELDTKIVDLKTTGKSIAINNASLSISYRIVDVTTSQLKYSAEVSGESQNSSVVELSKDLANKAVVKILNAIFPISVLAVDSSTVTLGQGGDMLKPGQKLKLVKLGQALVDPHTHESLGRQESIVGEVEVIDVQAKISTAKLLTPTAELQGVALIVRPYVEDSVQMPTAKSVEENTANTKRKIKTIEKDDM